ncbi:hypothetical protein AB4542_11285 [Vibrio breoganii]
MKRLKILFLENEVYFSSLGVFNSDLFQVECDGINILQKSINKIESYDLVASLLYNNPLSNYYIYKAKESLVPTLLLSDGMIEWENMFSNPSLKSRDLKLFHPIQHDYFFCVGYKETFYFNQLGINTIQFLPKRTLNMKQLIKIPGNKTFLITTANTAYYNDKEMTRLIDLMSNLMKQLKLCGIDYIFRVFDSNIVEKLSIPHDKNYISGSFPDVLSQVDCVITTPSSISIEAMSHGRPVAHLLYRDSPVFLQSGWNISNSVDLESCLKSMLSRDKERLDFQSAEVKRYMLEADSSEAELLIKIETFKPKDIAQFVNQNHLNLLNSKFNFNIEYSLRAVYLKFKKNKFLQFLRKRIW